MIWLIIYILIGLAVVIYPTYCDHKHNKEAYDNSREYLIPLGVFIIWPLWVLFFYFRIIYDDYK